jgi:alpha-ketoglutaric semialdehyde dehydrogenase
MVPNFIAGRACEASGGERFEKLNPHDGRVLSHVARSGATDVAEAVRVAAECRPGWGATTPVDRGEILFAICAQLHAHREAIARTVAAETGKSFASALGETNGAIALGRFFAGEGQRLYGRTTTSAVRNKHAMTVRQPVGVAGLIVPANTPIANVAWKVFPALICGNGAVLKSAEDSPATALLFTRLAHEAGLPAGVLNLVHGFGPEAGEELVADARVGVISFTGSTGVGRRIAAVAGERLAKVSLELGGKNPLVVCDDADLDERRGVGSSCSTRSTSGSETGWSSEPGSCGSAPATTTISARSSTHGSSTRCSGRCARPVSGARSC